MREEVESVKVNGCCAVSSAASIGCGLGSGSFCQTSTPGTEVGRGVDVEENRYERVRRRLVDERNDWTQ